ncbi:hypothetical protein [Hymenobacter arizonensis]|uniref:Uncharacterized protein n=1 Tax=Hymenobacter arizonensis TaxID=1227077 RepID=A0A1I5WNC3_HYMAR|nr:hypothetical protein [Hymenobacter arizonensis]SFQ21209.1 hypothetical protein SAMN04515668_1406 [Hymenobacter arizonensis]
MKRTLLSLFFTVAVATGASAQAGWGSDDSWGAPKKSSTKKTTTTKAATSGQTRAPGNQATPQNDGRTVSPYPSAPAQPDVNPGNTASTPPDNSFVPGPTSGGNGNGGNDRAGMSAAPGTPVMLQSGRSVMANDAAAARERRQNRMNKINRPAVAPTQVTGGDMTGASQATSGANGAVAPRTGATGADAMTAPAAAPSATAPASGTTNKTAPAKTKAKAPAAPSGW